MSVFRILSANATICDGRQLAHRRRAWWSYCWNKLLVKRAIQAARRRQPGRKVVCISKVMHLGDIVACEPVARQIRRQHPQAFIIWCLQKPYREIMQHHPAVDYVLAVACLTEWMLFAEAGLFDEIVDLEMNHRPCDGCKLSLRKQHDPGVTFENYYRLGCLLDVFSRCAGLHIEDQGGNRDPSLYLPDSVRERAGQLLPQEGKYLAVHCFSNESSRDWRIEKWRELLTWVSKEWDLTIIEVGQQAGLAQLGLPRYISMCGQLSILETAEAIRRSVLFIGVDSGPAHLANAVGTKGVILIGRYASFVKYQPYSGKYASPEHARLVYSMEPAANIPVEEVKIAVSEILSQELRGRDLQPRELEGGGSPPVL